MLYAFLKIAGRPAIRIFCRRIIINNPAMLADGGPLLIACNHPNSFLDAVILDLYFKKSIYSLARGDAFINKGVRRILDALKILPVYRTSEGVENLSENYKTFAACIELFRKNKLVLMFSEGKCVNEWRLRPLKKGTARLALKCWENNIPVRVLPVGLNYSSFDRIGKVVFVNFGNLITSQMIDMQLPEGLRYQAFNNLLYAELGKTVFEIAGDDMEMRGLRFKIVIPRWKKRLLFFPACLGWILNAPLYMPVRAFVKARYQNTEHYDAVLMGLLLITYPVYVILFIFVVFLFVKSWIPILCLVLFPMTAWAYTQSGIRQGDSHRRD